MNEDELKTQLERIHPLMKRIVAYQVYIDMAEKTGFYFEALVRLDALMDLSAELMLDFVYVSDEEQEVVNQFHEALTDRYFRDYAIKILIQKNLLDSKFMKQIERFRNVRNTAIHDVFGTWKLLKGKTKLKVQTLEEREKELLQSECKNGKRLLADILNDYLSRRFGITKKFFCWE